MAEVVRTYAVENFSAGNTAEMFGQAELTANIAALNRELANALPEIVMEAALIVEEEIRSRAPVDTGALVRSLDAKSERRQQAASAVVQIERSGPDGTEHYAVFQEFGTSKMPAQPFFRPGVEASRQKVGELMQSKILEVIDK